MIAQLARADSGAGFLSWLKYTYLAQQTYTMPTGEPKRELSIEGGLSKEILFSSFSLEGTLAV
jgi:hypothetical protein